MANCVYCGGARSGDPTKVACPICGQKVPVKPMINSAWKPAHLVSKTTMAQDVVTLRAEQEAERSFAHIDSQAQALSRSVAPVRVTADQLKRTYQERVAIKKKNTQFSPLRLFATLMCLPLWLFSLGPLALSFEAPMGKVDGLGLFGGIVPAVVALIISRIAGRGFIRSLVATGVYGISALLIFGKPFKAPIQWEYNGTITSSSPTSETHLYFLIPGAILILFTVMRGISTLVDFGRMFRKSEEG